MQIRFVTRSGTSRYSGSMYEYFRHPRLSANNFFNIGDNLEASFYRPGIELNDRATWNKGRHNL